MGNWEKGVKGFIKGTKGKTDIPTVSPQHSGPSLAEIENQQALASEAHYEETLSKMKTITAKKEKEQLDLSTKREIMAEKTHISRELNDVSNKLGFSPEFKSFYTAEAKNLMEALNTFQTYSQGNNPNMTVTAGEKAVECARTFYANQNGSEGVEIVNKLEEALESAYTIQRMTRIS